MRLVATEKATGKDVAFVDVVLPVSEETTCSDCHDRGGPATQRTGITWSAAADKESARAENVLLLHHNMNGTSLMASKPVLCAGCHYSPALDLAGTGPSPHATTAPDHVLRDARVSQQQDAGLHGRLDPTGWDTRYADAVLLHLPPWQEHEVPARRDDRNR